MKMTVDYTQAESGSSLVEIEKFEKAEDEESDIDIGGGDNENEVRNGESSDPEDKVTKMAASDTCPTSE